MNIYRTSQGSMTRLLRSNIGRLEKQMREVETQAISGLKLSRPSDGPAEVASALKLQGLVQDQGEYQDNISRALSFQSTMDDALSQAGEIFKRAREIGVAGATEGYDATSRVAMGIEVEGLMDSLLAVANTRIGDRSLFAGEAYDGEAFDSSYVYQGGNEAPETRISTNLWAETGMDGSEVFQGSVDVFQTLDDLKTALQANDNDAVFDLLDEISDSFDQISASRQRMGHEQKMTLDAEETSGNIQAILVGEYNAIVQIDQAETYVRLGELQQSYTAALRVGASSMSGKLFEYI